MEIHLTPGWRGKRLKTELRRKHVALAPEPRRRGAQAIAWLWGDGLRSGRGRKESVSVPGDTPVDR